MTVPDTATDHGRLGLSSPWARVAIPAEQREAIAALIPPSYVIGVSGHAHGGGRSFRVWAYGPDGLVPGLDWRNRHDPVNAARAIAERLSMLRCSECGDLLDAFGCCVKHGLLDTEALDGYDD